MSSQTKVALSFPLLQSEMLVDKSSHSAKSVKNEVDPDRIVLCYPSPLLTTNILSAVRATMYKSNLKVRNIDGQRQCSKVSNLAQATPRKVHDRKSLLDDTAEWNY